MGIDLSLAVEAAQDNFARDPDVLIVQGDLLKPPFRDQVFDGGFTIGVLHHLPAPLEGLKALVRSIRPMGWVASRLYPKGGFYDSVAVARMRQIHNRLKPLFGHGPALAYTYLSALLLVPLTGRAGRSPALRRLLDHPERNWLVCLHLPDVRWRLLDTFDAITPAIASTHTGHEVRTWMSKSGCASLRTTGWCETSVVGVKQ